jgi:hypothetical protein
VCVCMCKSAIALYLNIIKRECNQGANKSNNPNYSPPFSSRVPPYTRQYLSADNCGRGQVQSDASQIQVTLTYFIHGCQRKSARHSTIKQSEIDLCSEE